MTLRETLEETKTPSKKTCSTLSSLSGRQKIGVGHNLRKDVTIP